MKKVIVDEGYLGWQLLIILEVVIINSLPYTQPVRTLFFLIFTY